MTGQTISHYKILSKLGSGGMGEVFIAEDTKLKRKAVLKFLHPHLSEKNEILERFEREAQAAAALNHPSIVTIYEIDRVAMPDSGKTQTFIAMEHVDGHSLRAEIEKGSMDVDRAIDIVLQLCDGLGEAHKAGIVHRDIKPENILIDNTGRVKILDFGLARIRGATKLTKEASTLGTAYYISPEQYQGKEVDHRSDIWSLGVVFYEMLAGEVPFKGDYEQAVIYAILNEDPTPVVEINPKVSGHIEDVLRKLLMKEQTDRYQQCEAISDGIRRTEMKSKSDKAQKKQKPKRSAKRGVLYLIPSVLIVLIVSWFAFLNNQNQKLDSIAILPFQNNSPDPNLEFLSREVPANIINNLSRLPDLRVVPRTTVFQYADRVSDLGTIGQELKVTTALTGEVSVIGERLIIRAELVDIENDRQIWGERFESRFEDLLKIEEEITTEISEVLPLQLTNEEKSSLIRRYTENIEAYRTYMEGRFWWNKRTQKGFERAEALFKRAIEIDPDYALAYAGLAECYCMVSINMARPETVIRKARIAAERALAIDETLAQAHVALAWTKFAFDWDWLGAERSFKRAIQLDPRYAIAYNWYAVMLSFIGRYEKAVEYMTRAREYDPGSSIINRDLGIVTAWAGDLESALYQIQFTIEMDPDFAPAYHLMGVVHIMRKDYAHAIEYFEKARAMTGDYFDIIGSLGYTFAVSGQREAALRELQKLKDLAEVQDVRASEICLIYCGLRNHDQVFEWLDISCRNREFAALVLLGCELKYYYKDLMSDPRFEELLFRIGIQN